jgi:diacylglycerol O-acyltransferase
MSPTDSMFLIPESRDQPMHVGSLQLYRRPPNAGKDFLVDAYHELLRADDIAYDFRKRAHRSFATLGQWAWVEDADVDLEHHIRHSALPRPGRIRELLALVSRLHSTLLDRSRPLWETHLIEGLDDDRFAVYTKVHHAMMDGVSGLRLLQQSLATEPDEDAPIAWFSQRAADRSAAIRAARRAARAETPASSAAAASRSAAGQAFALPMAAARAAGDLAGLGPTLVRMTERALRETRSAMPMSAPRSMFNVGISGSRRFAAQSWSLERLRAVSKATGTTLNDVVLAMCSGALRHYLLELDALPDSSLIAMTPVSLRREDTGGGNAVGSLLANLGTDIDDAGERLAIVHDSMQQGKETLSGLNQLQATALSALMMAPITATLVSGTAAALLPPVYNLVISNVPGPDQPLYFRGAELEGIYPLSIPTNGQALNITLTSYNGNLEFGLIGCRRHVPHLQRLLVHLEDSLVDLEKATAA